MCGRRIDVGEQHRKISGLRDGVWLCFRTCMACGTGREDDMTVAEMLAEFHAPLGQPFGRSELGNAELRRKLHAEEGHELDEALASGDVVAIAHELADVVYVAYGTAHTLGIPLDAVIAEVHRANMSKFDAAGQPVLRDDGKLLKSDQFVPADVAGVLNRGVA